MRLKLEGADYPGILSNVAEYLASQGINFEELSTKSEAAPFGGTTLFKMAAIVRVPEVVDINLLQTKIADVESNLGVSIQLIDEKQQ